MVPLSVRMMATISEKFSKLINKNEYEPRLCKLMNASQRVFPGRYEWIADQPSGECDFVEHALQFRNLIYDCREDQ